MTKKVANIVSLGCFKNLVDSERLLKMLYDCNFNVVHNGKFDSSCDVTIINTCGFIGDAKEESINTILSAIKAKEEGFTKKVFVMGCLSERYKNELPLEIPEVDKWFGKMDWSGIVNELIKSSPASSKYDRILTTPKHQAYVKIAEGCDRFCAFCAIPLITGRYTSRSVNEIVEEVKMLVDRGVKEFNIIAQDLTSYGADLKDGSNIAILIDKLAKIEGVKWIRLHYAYPNKFPYDLLDVISKHDNVCKYLDVALQHVNDTVLKNMRRHITGEETREFLNRVRKQVPGIHLRTTLMVGFPGEDDEAFNELMEFVKTQRFERMGAFAYCEEEDTFAAKNYKDDIPDEVKQSRLERLMQLQEEISYEIQQQKIGKELTVIIDREEVEWFVGRTEYDSPEVDPEVIISKKNHLKIGEFYKVKIVDALPFELIAEVVE